MNADGSGLTQVTHDINVADFGLSPDGKTLALHDYPNDRIVAVAVDGSGSPVTLLDKPSGFIHPKGKLGKKWTPAWTPDGKAVVLTTNLHYGLHGTRLYIVNADGSGLSAVPGIETAIDASWQARVAGVVGERRDTQPSATQATESPQPTDLQLPGHVKPRRTRMNSRAPRRPEFIVGGIRSSGIVGKWTPVWSPDGKALALATSSWGADMGTRLYIVNADGTGLSAVPGVEAAMDPAWRPE